LKNKENKELIFTVLNHTGDLEKTLTKEEIIDELSPLKVHLHKDPKKYLLEDYGTYITNVSKAEDGNLMVEYTEKNAPKNSLTHHVMKLNPKTLKQKYCKEVGYDFIEDVPKAVMGR